MHVVSYTELRKDMKRIMDKTQDGHEPVIITRKGGHMVMMSLEDYNGFEETAYLLRNPKNAQRIFASLAQLEAGKGEVHELVEV